MFGSDTTDGEVEGVRANRDRYFVAPTARQFVVDTAPTDVGDRAPARVCWATRVQGGHAQGCHLAPKPNFDMVSVPEIVAGEQKRTWQPPTPLLTGSPRDNFRHIRVITAERPVRRTGRNVLFERVILTSAKRGRYTVVDGPSESNR